MAAAKAAMARRETILKSNISCHAKFNLYKSLVVYILLHKHQTWTLLIEAEKKIQVFKNKCLWKLLGIFYWDHKTTSLKVSWADRNIFSPLLNERCHGLATSQCITASARPGTVEGEHNRGQQGWSKIMTCQFWNASVPPTPDYPGGGFRFLQPLGLSNDWSSQETDDMNQL